MKKTWVGNKSKWFYSELAGNIGWWGEAREIPVGLSMYGGPKETVEYIWVHVKFDCWVFPKLQQCTFLEYSWSTSKECKKRDADVAGRDKLCKNSNQLQG